MGVKFYQHMGGRHIYCCRECGINFTNMRMKMNANFRGSSGPAYLFTKVVNIVYSDVEERNMLSGPHIVRDAICKRCNKTIGWMYEFAYNKDQKYKEGMIVLERAYISSHAGIREI